MKNDPVGETYSYYFGYKELPILFLLICLLSPLLFLLQLLQCFSPESCFTKYCTQYFIDPFTDYFFKSEKKIEDNEEFDEGVRLHTISKFVVPFSYKLTLLIMMVNMLGVVAIQFLDVFLLEESYTCNIDLKFACFPKFPNMSTPRLDCSDTNYLKANNITSVICYRFVFRLGTATGSALGLATAIVLATYIINLFMTLVLELLLKLYEKNENKCCKASIIIFIMLLRIVFAATIMGFAIALSVYQVRVSYTRERQATIIARNVLTGGTMAFYGVLMLPWYQLRDQKYDKNRVYFCAPVFCVDPTCIKKSWEVRLRNRLEDVEKKLKNLKEEQELKNPTETQNKKVSRLAKYSAEPDIEMKKL